MSSVSTDMYSYEMRCVAAYRVFIFEDVLTPKESPAFGEGYLLRGRIRFFHSSFKSIGCVNAFEVFIQVVSLAHKSATFRIEKRHAWALYVNSRSHFDNRLTQFFVNGLKGEEPKRVFPKFKKRKVCKRLDTTNNKLQKAAIRLFNNIPIKSK